MSQVSVLFGTQWGDEGKGKWIDQLAAQNDIVARFQGGNNAGHTLIRENGQKVVLHHLPSGILLPEKISVLGGGMVINPLDLIKEMDQFRDTGNIDPRFFWISARAHVITPWHLHLDSKQELSAATPIGTTKKGIGPTYADKVSRRGLRMEAYVDFQACEDWIKHYGSECPEFVEHRSENKELWQKWSDTAIRLRAFVCDAEAMMARGLQQGLKVLAEGAQGALLDIGYGTYPFVTSSNPGVGGVLVGCGLSHKSIGKVIGIGKVYLTRVGGGPFPTQIPGDLGNLIADRGQEFGATTGRRRQVGWFDVVAMRYVHRMNAIDELYLNKLDILTGVEELKIAVAYRHPQRGELKDFPSSAHVLSECEAVYESFAGWTDEVPKSGKFTDLPKNAQVYLNAIQKLVGVPVTKIGTGPGRHEYVTSLSS